MVMFEAMYFGASIISSYNGGSVFLIRNENYEQMIRGFFNPVLWAEVVEKYINTSTYTELDKKNARQLIKSEYTWDSIVDKTIAYFEKGLVIEQ